MDYQELSREAIERRGIGEEGGYIEEAEILRVAVKPVRGAEVWDSALSGDARPGKNDNPAGMVEVFLELLD